MATSVVTCELCDDLKLTDTAYEKHVATTHPPKEEISPEKEEASEDKGPNKPNPAAPRKPERK